MQAESGIVPDFEVGEEFHEEPKTYYELKSQPLKSSCEEPDAALSEKIEILSSLEPKSWKMDSSACEAGVKCSFNVRHPMALLAVVEFKKNPMRWVSALLKEFRGGFKGAEQFLQPPHVYLPAVTVSAPVAALEKELDMTTDFWIQNWVVLKANHSVVKSEAGCLMDRI
ncbi:hypothetical protein TURU_100880 [Turdus rufiventris]|nr:hypothetical protein TURU_100880 [Turdus rufiventris]